jgi:hypothetical protein
LKSTGNIQLAGTLNLLIASDIPIGTYTVIRSTGGTVTGSFTNITYNGSMPRAKINVVYTSNTVNVVISSALSVELLDFKAQNTQGGNLLTWQTASEINNKGFQIERSFDGKTFENIGFAQAKGGNSTYTFTDNTPLPIGSGQVSISYYRLRQIDNDGKETFSKVVNVRLQKEGFSVKTYPNPFKENVTIEVSTDKKTDVTIELIDILGRQMFLKKTENTEGVLSVPISTEGWANGTYFLKISDSQSAIHEKIVKN